MSSTPQKRALNNYRKRIKQRGMARFEVLGLDADRAVGATLCAELARIAPDGWPQHYQSELCPLLAPWIASIAAALARGVVLLIDYGLPRREYYHVQRP